MHSSFRIYYNFQTLNALKLHGYFMDLFAFVRMTVDKYYSTPSTISSPVFKISITTNTEQVFNKNFSVLLQNDEKAL